MKSKSNKIRGASLALYYVPKIFEIFSWIIVLGILKAVSLKSEVAWYLYASGYAFLGLYIYAFLSSSITLKMESLPVWLEFVILILAIAIVYGVSVLLRIVTSDIAIFS